MSEIITRGELPRRPIPGLVIRYSYLWHREAEEKRIEGLKSRPCAVVLSHSNSRLFPGRFVADVVPITHTPTDGAVEIPVSVKRRMGLDNDPSWIVTTEINRFFWPGLDIRRAKEEWQQGGPAWHWGILPVNIFNQAKEAVLKHRAEKTLAIVPRSY
jgi:hypothetical protein